VRRRFVLVLGGTSDIGRAVAHAFAARGWGVQLAGRDLGLVTREADDVAARHRVPVSALPFDVLDFDGAAGFAQGVDPLPDVVVSVVGLMGADDPADVAAVRVVVDTNFTGPAIVLAAFAERFRARGSGTLVGVSSVAGERGRA
jgi:NAD(P)-dependent dehydrogenase (short-subunit alcohol dehydrogenase family)